MSDELIQTSGDDAAKRLVSLAEAAEISGLSQGHLRLLAKQEKIWAVKIGRNWVTTREAVQEHFEQQGNVVSVRLMKDRRTGKRKGYGFVEMNTKGAVKAIKNLNDSTFQERTLKVRLAKEKVESE